MESVSGTLTICLPYAAIEPIIPKLKAQFQSEEQEVDHVWVRRLRTELLTTEIELVAEYSSTLPVDDDHPYRSGAWRPNTKEFDAYDLEVVGDLPSDLSGVYLRNTENPLQHSIGRSVSYTHLTLPTNREV